LKAAVYNFLIDGNGYVSHRYGQKTFFGDFMVQAQQGTPIMLTPGQNVKGLTVRVTPTGTVSGRVRDTETREAVAGVVVQLMRLEYGATGERSLVGQQGLVQTNDRGEYRFYFVTPGRYYVKAGGPLPRNTTRRETNPNVIATDYGPTIFPSAANTQGATIVEVRPGGDIGGIDLSVGKRVLYSIRGRVVDSATGGPPVSASSTVYQRSNTGWERAETSGGGFSSSTGTFTISGLPPGSYQLVVQASIDVARAGIPSPVLVASLATAIAFQTPGARPADTPGYGPKIVPIEISGSNVDGLVIPVSRSVPVLAIVTLDGDAALAPRLNGSRIVLRSSDRLLSSLGQISWNTATGEGRARFTDLAATEYRAIVQGVPAGFYAKEASFGGADALRGLRIEDGEVNVLNVVISPNVAVVEGTLRNERSEIMPGSMAVLVPERDRDRTELYQRAIADLEGRFRFPGVAPGNYKLFAWEALEPNAYFDPEVLRPVEQRGRAIQLAESARQSVDLVVSPAN
jgi:hypothetical protein